MSSLLNRCSDEDFISIVKESSSISDIERKLGYNAMSGSVFQNIKKRIKDLQLDTSHFKSVHMVSRTFENTFVKDSTAVQSTLRRFYSQLDIPYVCSICGQEPEWQGRPLTLILDHINGNNKDDRLENLRWVCPNCNQQLDTTGSKNQAYKNLSKKSENHCIDCGAIIEKRSFRCRKCAGKHRQEDTALPCSREELKVLLRTMPFTQIGIKYNVTDNAVRRWCDRYQLPRRASEIRSISDKDWKKI